MPLVPLLLVLLAVLASAATPGEGRGEPSPYEHPYETDADRVPSLVTGGSCLVRGATIHTAVGPPFVGDVRVEDGVIREIGPGLATPAGLLVLEGDGRHLVPGAVDTHSHMAVDGSVNEGTLSITADCDISDVIEPDDVALYRALAGGTTTIQVLHGSANAIGGRSEVLKLRWGATADGLRFEGAPQGIKFALGENPKRSNWGDGGRFPATRMGVESLFQRAFARAAEYRREWAEHERRVAAGEDPLPPRRDVRLEVLAGVLSGAIDVHSHCYRADEIVMLLRTAEHFGFRIKTLQHVLEGYKVAREIAEHGAGASTFSDWWSYKIEAYDAIPHNAALMDEAGVLASINSDSHELVRHLYPEAGKSVRYAGMDRVRALALVTLNGAHQLGLEGRVGSIEVGKDADLVLMTGDPLSFLSRVEWTMVDGEIRFQRRDAFGLDAEPLGASELVEAATAATPSDSAAGPPPEGDAEGELVALVGATLHPITAPAIERGVLLVRGGRIEALGADVVVPQGARVVDLTGRHVWPGLIALNTSLGLREIDSVRGTDDQAEIGGNQPDLRVAASIHADSEHLPVTRANGITRAQVAPQGGGPMMGQSALVQLDGFTWEEMLVADRDMLHVRFPRARDVEDDDDDDDDEKESRAAVEELRRLFQDALQYGRLREEAAEQGTPPPLHDGRLEALVPFARAEKPVALHASNAQTILKALRFAQELELRAVLFGARDGWKVVSAIAAAGIPVVVGPVLALPSSRFDPYDAPYANAAVLHRAGVCVALMSDDSENPRNLVFHAAAAAGHGLPREEALRAITFYPARILGVEDRVGSLAPGKVADLVVTDGDLLETCTSVTGVWIAGREQELENRQTRLYRRYRDRLTSR